MPYGPEEEPKFDPESPAAAHYQELHNDAAFAAEMESMKTEVSSQSEREMEFYFRQPHPGFEQIQSLVTDEEFSRFLQELDMIDTQTEMGISKYLDLAKTLKEFDPARFESGYRVPKSVWIRLVGYLSQQPRQMDGFLQAASAMRLLDAEAFDNDVNLEGDWDLIASGIKSKMTLPEKFPAAFAAACNLNYGEITSRIQIPSEDWQKITSRASSSVRNPIEYASLTAATQAIVPPDKTKPAFNEKAWERCQKELTIQYNSVLPAIKNKNVLGLSGFLKNANEVKYVQNTQESL